MKKLKMVLVLIGAMYTTQSVYAITLQERRVALKNTAKQFTDWFNQTFSPENIMADIERVKQVYKDDVQSLQNQEAFFENSSFDSSPNDSAESLVSD